MAVTACCVSCGDTVGDRLDSASRLVNYRPDSAYTILRDIDYTDLRADSLKAKYILTKAIANIRVGRSLITDTLLNDAASYYLSAGDTTSWVLATQLLSGHDFVRGDSKTSMDRLENMIPLIKNRELLWDTYIHLLEVSINSGDYASAYRYADRLLNNTNVPEHVMKYAVAKGGSMYMQGQTAEALALFDSIATTDCIKKISPEAAREFMEEYVEILDGAGHSSRAIAITDSLYSDRKPENSYEKVTRHITLAQLHANAGNLKTATAHLDSINHEETKSIFETYASIAMLKAALEFKQSGRFPSELMHKVTKNIHRSHMLAQFDRQTALESVMELNDDNYELKLQRQRLWLLICIILIGLTVSGGVAYHLLNRRKQRLIEAEERAETLERMLDDYSGRSNPTDREKLRSALLKQLGIFKTFASTPTPQSRDALRKISTAGNGDMSIESLVDWPEFYSMIDNLYDGFHTRLITDYPNTFNDKEQQIIVLLKAGFSTKEIGVLTEQSSATIYTRKSVIRKKLATPENGDFIAQLDARNNAD